MARAYEIRVKPAALDNLKKAREGVREQLGTRGVGERLANLSDEQAGELANALLSLLDAVDAMVSRAKPAE